MEHRTGRCTSDGQDLETAQAEMVAWYGPRRRCVIAAGTSVSWAPRSAPVVERGPAAAGTVEVAEVLHGWPPQLPLQALPVSVLFVQGGPI
jgi:hypothetical protein